MYMHAHSCHLQPVVLFSLANMHDTFEACPCSHPCACTCQGGLKPPTLTQSQLLPHECVSMVQLLLIVPFMRLGEFLLRAEKLDVKPAALLDLIKQLIHDPGKPALAVAHALFGWIVVIIPGCVLLTLALTPIFAAIKKR